MEVFWVLVDMLDSAGKPVVVDAMVLGKPLPGAFCFVNEAKQKDELQGLLDFWTLNLPRPSMLVRYMIFSMIHIW